MSVHPDLNIDRLVSHPHGDMTQTEQCVSNDVLSEIYWKLSPKTQSDRYNIQIYHEAVKGSGELHASSSDDKDIGDSDGILNRLAALYGKKWEKISLGEYSSWVINPNKLRTSK